MLGPHSLPAVARLTNLENGRQIDHMTAFSQPPDEIIRRPAVILGHVDSATGTSVFYYLKNLRAGDTVDVTLADGTVARFAVDGLQKVAKDAFPTASVYGKSGDPSLRLITCGGPFDQASGHYTDNIIVYAHLAGS